MAVLVVENRNEDITRRIIEQLAREHNRVVVSLDRAEFRYTVVFDLLGYLCTDVYVKEADAAIAWNDGDIAVDWPISAPSLSAKDQQAPLLRDVADERLPVYAP